MITFAAVQVVVPPLRERREDVLVIAEHVPELRSKASINPPKGFQPSCDLFCTPFFPGQCRRVRADGGAGGDLGRNGEPLQPWDLCGFQSCPYLGGAPQATCGFCAEGLSAKG